MAVRSTSSLATTGTTTPSCPKPAGTASGDELLFLVVGGWTTLTPTDSMVQVGSDVALHGGDGTTLVGNARLYRRLAGGSEPANYIFTQDVSQSVIVLAAALTGRNTSAPVSANAGGVPSGPALVLSASSLTGVAADDLLVFGFSRDGARTWTPPSGMTELLDIQQALGGGATATLAKLENIAAGATGAKKLIESWVVPSVLDDFNRTTGLGSNWAILGGASRLNIIASNMLQTDPAGGGGEYWTGTGPGSADYTNRVTVKQWTASNANGLKMLLRMANPSASPRNGYSLKINVNTATGVHDWQIRDEVTGQPVLASGTQAVAVGDDVAFRVVGNILQGWYFPASGDPVLVVSYNDTTAAHAATGSHGILLDAGTYVDDYRVGTADMITQPGTFIVAVAAASGSPSAPANTVLPAITGTTRVGSTLTVGTGTWTNTPTSYTYQWQRDDGNGVFANIGGATSNTYTLVTADDALSIRAVVTAVNASGSTAANAVAVGPVGLTAPSVDSTVIGPIITSSVVPSNTVAPSIAGAPQIGVILFGNDGTWSGDTSRTRKWQTDATGSWVDIPGATNQQYHIAVADLTHNLRYVVTGINSQGSTTANSSSVGPVTDPTILTTPIQTEFGTSWADAVYAEMSPVTADDASLGNPFLTYVRGFGSMFQEIDYFARQDSVGDAWSRLLDADRIPAEALPWLGQFVGAYVDTARTEAVQRGQVTGVQGWQRGAAAAMQNAITPLLTGNKQVVFAERDGDPYNLTVITRSSETPDPAAVLAALVALKPAAIKLQYLVATGNTYLEVRTTYATYTALRSAVATYAALRGY